MKAGKVGTWLTVINVSTYLPAFSRSTARFFSSHNYKFLAEQKNNLNEKSWQSSQVRVDFLVTATPPHHLARLFAYFIFQIKPYILTL